MPRRVFRCATAPAAARGGFLVFCKKTGKYRRRQPCAFNKAKAEIPPDARAGRSIGQPCWRRNCCPALTIDFTEYFGSLPPQPTQGPSVTFLRGQRKITTKKGRAPKDAAPIHPALYTTRRRRLSSMTRAPWRSVIHAAGQRATAAR